VCILDQCNTERAVLGLSNHFKWGRHFKGMILEPPRFQRTVWGIPNVYTYNT